jgi:hypothetical protein
MCDETILAIARPLAQALSKFAHSRSAEDKKEVARLHTELCAEYRKEQEPRWESSSAAPAAEGEMSSQ